MNAAAFKTVLAPYDATQTLPVNEIKRIAGRIDPTQPAALAYDGTLEGLLTCVFVAYAAQDAHITDVLPGAYLQPRLGQQIVAVPTSMQAAQRVQRGIERTCGHDVWIALVTASAADDPDTGTSCLRFIQYAMQRGGGSACGTCPHKAGCTTPCARIHRTGVLSQLTHPAVEPILRLQKRVINETEKMRQFMRFSHVEGDLWFARCNPNCSVVPFVMGHFAARFNTQRFAIYDENHHIAGISEGGRWQLVSTDSIVPPPAASDEAAMQDAWKRFYDALTIDCRYNPELRRSFMPIRLWKHITELQP